MITKHPYEKGLGPSPGIDTRYYGKDAEDFLESINWHEEIDYIGKNCITDSGEEGVIIGFEDSESYMDYYYIVYIPETGKVDYALANSASFVKNIEK